MGKKHKEKRETPTDNPYINGKREWMERYGDFISAKRRWQGLAFLAILLAAVATMGAISLAKKSEFVPYVVEVDKLGQVRNVSQPTTNFKVNHVHTKGILAGWIQNTRSVYTDGAAQRAGVRRSFACINKADPAFIYLSDFSKKNWQRASEETVDVEIIGSPLPITNKSWQIEWKETVKSNMGELIREETWKGNFQIYNATPKTPKTLLDNPLGIYIKTISWTKQGTKNF